MMPYEMRENSGSLFKNDKKTEERQPGWKGSVLIGGVEYWCSGWVKPTKAGGKWISLAFEPKGDYQAPEQRQEDDGDQIPF